MSCLRRRQNFQIGDDDTYEIETQKVCLADVFWYTNSSLGHVGVVIHYKDQDRDAGHPCKKLHRAKTIKAKSIGLNDVLWVETRYFRRQEQEISTELKICIENTQISEEIANKICEEYNQRDEMNRCEDSQSFIDHMIYELRLTPRFTFKQMEPEPPPSFFSFLYSSSKTSSLGSRVVLSSKVAEEFGKLIKKDLKSCKRNMTEVLQSLQIDDVLTIAEKIIMRLSSLEEVPTDWKEYIKIFGEELWAVLGPKFFKKFIDDDMIRRMGDKFKSLLVFIDFAKEIRVDPLRAVFLWFAIQVLIYFIQKVS